MPKRPSAVTLTPDNAKILIADKFGDVYAIPLNHDPPAPNPSTEADSQARTETPKQPFKPFKPAATPLTVHSARNRKALQDQQRTGLQPSSKRQQSLSFPHELLLGHVSLLTDLACLTVPAEASPSEKQRSYILTSDRDEHVRVSRGMPQAHVVEGYCLGHGEFVSKICVLQAKGRRMMISGGGDDFLLLWDWVEGACLSKVDLLAPLHEFMGLHYPERANVSEIAVSGIWDVTVPAKDGSEAGEGTTSLVLVALEGYALFISFLFTPPCVSYPSLATFPRLFILSHHSYRLHPNRRSLQIHPVATTPKLTSTPGSPPS